MTTLSRSPGALLCRLLLAVIGWKAVCTVDPPRKAVIIAVPHTSNWDGFLMLVAAKALGLRIRWAFKADAAKGVVGWLLGKVGALPIRREGNQGVVEALVAEFGKHDDLLYAIAPSGTRKKTENWRSGFYHLARAAGVPVLFGTVDYAGKRSGLIGMRELTGDVAADMDAIRAGYAGTAPKFPAKLTPMRLRDETPTADAD